MPTPYEIVSKDLLSLVDQLKEVEERAIVSLPGVPWNFYALRGHLQELAGLVRQDLAMKATQAHMSFSVSPPAYLMGKKSSEKKRAAALRASFVGGSTPSIAKVLASRENLATARKGKQRKYKLWLCSLSSKQREDLESAQILKKELQLKKMRYNKLNRWKRVQPWAVAIRNQIDSLTNRVADLMPNRPKGVQWAKPVIPKIIYRKSRISYY
jgi:hypothetical protein